MAVRGTRSVTSAERALGIDRHKIQKWRGRLAATGTVIDAQRSGRPSSLSDEACAHLEHLVSILPSPSLRELASKLREDGYADHLVSHSTIQRALERRCPNVTRMLPQYKTDLTDKVKLNRINFAKRHARKSWKHVLFVDACKFTYAPSRRHTRYGILTYMGKRPVIESEDRHKGVCVYGGVSSKGTSPLVFVTGSSDVAKTYKKPSGQLYSGVGAEEYINVMENHLIPAGKSMHGDKLEYLQDWSGCHNSKAVKQYQRSVGLRVIEDFPSRSPDLNIIENVWAWMDGQMRKKTYHGLPEFKAALTSVWSSIPRVLLLNCTTSMKARLKAVLTAKGNRIKTHGL